MSLLRYRARTATWRVLRIPWPATDTEYIPAGRAVLPVNTPGPAFSKVSRRLPRMSRISARNLPAKGISRRILPAAEKAVKSPDNMAAAARAVEDVSITSTPGPTLFSVYQDSVDQRLPTLPSAVSPLTLI